MQTYSKRVFRQQSTFSKIVRLCCRYYEDNPETLDKAIMLYHKVCTLPHQQWIVCFQGSIAGCIPPSTLPPAILSSLSLSPLPPQAGEVSKALELCFQHRNFDALHQIAEDLGEETSPEMADQVAEYFQQVNWS